MVDLGPDREIDSLRGRPERLAVGGGEGHNWSCCAGAEEVGFFDAVDEGVVEDYGGWVDG